MEQTIETTGNKYYIKDNWRYIFWALIAFVALSYIGQVVMNVWFARMIQSGTKILLLVLAAKHILLAACWAFFYLAYGLKNNVKLFKVLFIIRAALQILWLAKNYFGDGYVQYYLTAGAGNPANILALATGTVYVALTLFDLVFFILMASSGQASALLRGACIFSIAVILLGAAYTFGSLFFIQRIVDGIGMQKYAMILGIASMVQALLGFASAGLFFGAMSFSKIRE